MANLMTLMGTIVSMIGLAIGLMVFGSILPNLNQTAIGSTAYNLISLTPILVAAVGLLAIVMGMFGTGR
jgi:hypothetical protein